MSGVQRFNPIQLVNGGVLGEYSLGGVSGLIAAGTTGELFQFRWPDTMRIAVIRKVAICVTTSTPFGAAPATPIVFHLAKATAWTGQGTGGTAWDTTTGSCRRRIQMPISALTAGDVRFSSTAALGAGTKVFDGLPLATVVGVAASANSVPVVPPMSLITSEDGDLDYPLVLSQNEGFSILVPSNPGTGTMFMSVSVDWMETAISW
jgi:hypothetical protein